MAKRIEYFKVALILPGNVLISIPLLIYLFTRNTYFYELIGPSNYIFYISLFCLTIGLWLAIWSVRTFYTKGGDGTPGPWKPVNNLVISGPYQYVRNPMLLGVFFLLLFESLLFSSMPFFYWFLIFYIGNIIYFINFEEKDLMKRFGSDYEDYRNNVSMIFPRFSPYRKD